MIPLIGLFPIAPVSVEPVTGRYVWPTISTRSPADPVSVEAVTGSYDGHLRLAAST